MTLVRTRLPLSLCLLLAATWACSTDRKGTGTPPGRKPSESQDAATKPKVDPSATAISPTGPGDVRPLVVTFGDSLSAGYGADPGKSYPDFLQKRIDAANMNYRVYNAGVSGDTTTDGLQRMPAIVAMKPQIVILELGGNDGLRGLPPAATKTNLETLIKGFQAAGAKVILAGMTLPRNYGKDYIHQFEQIYLGLASQYHLTRIPFLLQNVATNSKLMQPDGIHPTADGNKMVADNVFDVLKPSLTDSVKFLKK